MPTFHVTAKTIVYETLSVEADSWEDAVSIADDLWAEAGTETSGAFRVCDENHRAVDMWENDA